MPSCRLCEPARRMPRLMDARAPEYGARIEKVDDQWVVVGDELNQLWGIEGAVPLHHAATAIVRRFNRIARAEEAHYRPVRNIGRYEGPSHIAVVACDTASAALCLVSLRGRIQALSRRGKHSPNLEPCDCGLRTRLRMI